MKRITAGVLVLGIAAASSLRAHDRPRARLPLAGLGDRDACEAYGGLPDGWGADEHAGMLWISGGRFAPGSTEGYREERPAPDTPESDVSGFWIDRTEVTNAQFAAFVAATGYVTSAERAGTSAVFHAPNAVEPAERPQSWWRASPGASWRRPFGPDTNAGGRPSDPVVHVAYDDALAYARWLGRTLPSEDQWEYAARAGRSSTQLHGAPLDAGGRPSANFWQGEFPDQDRAEDGFAGLAPVACFAANRFGLHDMIGNVWEWTRDDYRARSDPTDRSAGDSPSCATGETERPKVIKGGSFLCAANFCARYRVSARHPHEPATTTNHIGFRTVSSGSTTL